MVKTRTALIASFISSLIIATITGFAYWYIPAYIVTKGTILSATVFVFTFMIAYFGMKVKL